MTGKQMRNRLVLNCLVVGVPVLSSLYLLPVGVPIETTDLSPEAFEASFKSLDRAESILNWYITAAICVLILWMIHWLYNRMRAGKILHNFGKTRGHRTISGFVGATCAICAAFLIYDAWPFILIEVGRSEFIALTWITLSCSFGLAWVNASFLVCEDGIRMGNAFVRWDAIEECAFYGEKTLKFAVKRRDRYPFLNVNMFEFSNDRRDEVKRVLPEIIEARTGQIPA